MISIQVPHFFNHPHQMSAYDQMAHPSFMNGMSAMHRPSPMSMGQSISLENKPKNSTPGAKRRPSRAGTRSVATLTTAQLERKRANDRECVNFGAWSCSFLTSFKGTEGNSSKNKRSY